MPDPTSGLGLSDSRNVPEGEHAIYKCMKDDHHVPGTPDGVFRVPCKRSGAFEQSMRTNWTACQVKPAKACTPLPQPGDGYKLVGLELLYTAEGQIVEFECEKPGYLAGNAKTASYKCTNDTNGYSFRPHSFTGKQRNKKLCNGVHHRVNSLR